MGLGLKLVWARLFIDQWSVRASVLVLGLLTYYRFFVDRGQLDGANKSAGILGGAHDATSNQLDQVGRLGDSPKADFLRSQSQGGHLGPGSLHDGWSSGGGRGSFAFRREIFWYKLKNWTTQGGLVGGIMKATLFITPMVLVLWAVTGAHDSGIWVAAFSLAVLIQAVYQARRYWRL